MVDPLYYTTASAVMEKNLLTNNNNNILFYKTLDYVKKYGCYKTFDSVVITIRILKPLCDELNIHPAEISFIQNLQLNTIEETKELIPRLRRITDYDLERILVECRRLRGT